MIKKYTQVFLGLLAASMLALPASANLLVNPGFEDTPFGGAEDPGAGVGWTGYSNFGGPFRIQCPGLSAGDPCLEPIGSSLGAHEGSVVLKAFGNSGAFQDFAASGGEAYAGSVWVLNPNNADAIGLGQVALALIIFFDAAGVELGAEASNVFLPDSPVDEWTQLLVSGIAPDGTAVARFQVLTQADPGAWQGAVRFDDASFSQVPVPAAVWLLGSGLLGLMGLRRK